MIESSVKIGNKEIKTVAEEKVTPGANVFGFFARAEAEAKTHKRGFASFAKTEKELTKSKKV